MSPTMLPHVNDLRQCYSSPGPPLNYRTSARITVAKVALFPNYKRNLPIRLEISNPAGAPRKYRYRYPHRSLLVQRFAGERQEEQGHM